MRCGLEVYSLQIACHPLSTPILDSLSRVSLYVSLFSEELLTENSIHGHCGRHVRFIPPNVSCTYHFTTREELSESNFP
jgi:hypothetical protein